MNNRYCRARIAAVALMGCFVAATAGCGSSGGGGGSGITIPPADPSPPTLSLGVGQQGGPSVSVSSGGSTQTANLIAKTGSLNVVATGKDSDSGVRTVQIFLNKRITRCQGTSCSPAGPGLAGAPRFESTGPQKQAGEVVAESSILADAIDLAQEIPQSPPPVGDSITVDLELVAKATNHLGGQVSTPLLHAIWKERG